MAWDGLGRTFERRVEKEAPCAHNEISNEGDKEDAVVAIAQAVVYALEREIDEQEIREGIHDLGRVDGGIIILALSSVCAFNRL